MKEIVFDYFNTSYIHKFFQHNIIQLPKDEFKFTYDLIYFADNYNISLNKSIEETFKKRHKNVIIFNSPVLNRWSKDRNYSFEIMKKIFKNNENVKILNWKFYKDINEVDWGNDKGVIKKNYSDAGYKTTYIFHSKEEMKNILENYKEEYKEGFIIQEFSDGEEIAFGTIFVNSEPIFPYYISFEYKKSISNEIGGNTGQSAEFGFFSNHEYGKKILNAISDYLKRNNIDYTGVIDINGAIKDKIFYPFEFTLCRDGYPEIVSFLYGNKLENILNKKVNWKGFRYILVVRYDIIENDQKRIEFKVNKDMLNNWIWIPECKIKEDSYITDNNPIIGLLYMESEEFLEIEFKPEIFNIPIIVYVSFNEDNKRKWEEFRWLYE